MNSHLSLNNDNVYYSMLPLYSTTTHSTSPPSPLHITTSPPHFQVKISRNHECRVYADFSQSHQRLPDDLRDLRDPCEINVTDPRVPGFSRRLLVSSDNGWPTGLRRCVVYVTCTMYSMYSVQCAMYNIPTHTQSQNIFL